MLKKKNYLLLFLIIINNIFLFIYSTYQFATICWSGIDNEGNKTGGCVPKYEFEQLNYYIVIFPIILSLILTLVLFLMILSNKKKV